MEAWFVVVVSICSAAILKSLFNFLFPTLGFADDDKNLRLPLGPFSVRFIGRFLWLRRSFSELEPIIREFRLKYGPLFALRVGSRRFIFVGSHSLAHQALVQRGAVFSDRPKALPTSKVFNSNQCNISSASYGPTWRLLRRNLTSEILHPSRVKSYARDRRWVLNILIERLLVSSQSGSAVRAVDDFQYAMFCLLVLMCFGDRLDEEKIKQIEKVQRQMILSIGRFNLLNFWPRLGKIILRSKWKKLLGLRRDQEDVLLPLIRARIRAIQEQREDNQERVVAYVDTLVDLQLLEEKRGLNDDEMVTLCSEFLNGGTDTTATALQWIMANVVMNPNIQARIYEEVTGVVGPPQSASIVEEEDLQKMPYVKAVVLEGLRRHPPGHFVLPHKLSEDVELDGYFLPRNATVNFMVAEMGRDPNVWDDPMEFKPERFLPTTGEARRTEGELFDLTGSREIKMMPFGAGRRICPGIGLALLHLEYFLANLIWHFEWKAVPGEAVDLSEKQEFTVVMKNPLRAHISPRVN